MTGSGPPPTGSGPAGNGSRWPSGAASRFRRYGVYRVGGLHFVEDGHHRVSIAAATGQETIDAYVTDIATGVAA